MGADCSGSRVDDFIGVLGDWGRHHARWSDVSILGIVGVQVWDMNAGCTMCSLEHQVPRGVSMRVLRKCTAVCL